MFIVDVFQANVTHAGEHTKQELVPCSISASEGQFSFILTALNICVHTREY